MKKILLILLFTSIFTCKTYSQISVGLEHTRFDYKQAIGVSFKYTLPIDNFDLQWNIGLNKADKDGFSIRLQGGIIVSSFLVYQWWSSIDTSNTFYGVIIGTILCAIPFALPNRISYDITKPNKNFDLSLYAEPFNVYLWNSSSEKKLSYAPQVGITFIRKYLILEAGVIYQVNVEKYGMQVGVLFSPYVLSQKAIK